MPVKIAICDDSPSDTQLLKTSLLSYDPLFEIESYASGEEFIDNIKDYSVSFDILFLDIYMQNLDGIEVAKTSQDFYPQAYEVFAFNYIVKPFDLKRLFSILDNALDEIRKSSGFKIHIQYKSSSYSVDVKKILYIESRNKKLYYHLDDGMVLQCYGKLDETQNSLPEHFLRCHQSFVVNLIRVSEMGDDYFRAGDNIISISRKYKKAARDKYYAFMFSQMGGRRL